jgi:tRNA threonylcarbamoyladenosine biosynthesis protein TsaE
MELIYSLSELNKTAKKLVDFFYENDEYKTIIFYGKMGSGKTTLIKEICKIMNSQDIVTSPSFAIINEYKTLAGSFLYHFDFYRLKNLQEAIDIGTEDYFYSGNYCFVEWPDIITPLLPEHTLKIQIEQINAEKRNLKIEKLKL